MGEGAGRWRPVRLHGGRGGNGVELRAVCCAALGAACCAVPYDEVLGAWQQSKTAIMGCICPKVSGWH